MVDKHEANLLRARYDTLSTGEKATFADHFGIPNATGALPEVRDGLVHRKIDEMEHRGKEGLAPPIHRESSNKLFGERGVGESRDMWDTGMAGEESGSQWEPGVMRRTRSRRDG